MKRGNSTQQKRTIRHKRIRARVKGSTKRPRLSIYRSNTRIYAQIIDDSTGKTIVAASDLDIKGAKGTKVARAKLVGAELARRAQEKKIEQVVFDRGGFMYTGRVKELADGAREGGLKF